MLLITHSRVMTLAAAVIAQAITEHSDYFPLEADQDAMTTVLLQHTHIFTDSTARDCLTSDVTDMTDDTVRLMMKMNPLLVNCPAGCRTWHVDLTRVQRAHQHACAAAAERVTAVLSSIDAVVIVANIGLLLGVNPTRVREAITNVSCGATLAQALEGYSA